MSLVRSRETKPDLTLSTVIDAPPDDVWGALIDHYNQARQDDPTLRPISTFHQGLEIQRKIPKLGGAAILIALDTFEPARRIGLTVSGNVPFPLPLRHISFNAELTPLSDRKTELAVNGTLAFPRFVHIPDLARRAIGSTITNELQPPLEKFANEFNSAPLVRAVLLDQVS